MSDSSDTTQTTAGTVPSGAGLVAPAATAPMLGAQRRAVYDFLSETFHAPDPKKLVTECTAEKRPQKVREMVPGLAAGDTLAVASIAVLGDDPAELMANLDLIREAGVKLVLLDVRYQFDTRGGGFAALRGVAAAAAAHAERARHVVLDAPGGGRPRKLDDRAVDHIAAHPEKTNRALARALAIDERTVRRYKQRIREAAGRA